MKVEVSNEKLVEKDINVGSVVVFERYGTSYVVHVADQAAIEKFNMGHIQNPVQLVRLDGQKPYRQKPFTGEELLHLVQNLGGEVYLPEYWKIQLVPKYS